MDKKFNQNQTNQTPREANYRLSGAFSAAMICYIFVALIFGLITQSLDNMEAFQKSTAYILLNYFLVSISLVLGCGYTLFRNKIKPFDAVNFKIDWRFSVVILLVFVGSYFGLSRLNDAFVSIFEKFGYVPDELKLPQKSPLNVILTIITVALLPAVCEEFLFRGLILNGTKWLGGLAAVLISAGCFCIYHMSPYQTAYQFVMGVIYGLVALKSQSLLPTVILHFLNNLFVILWYYFFPSFAITGTWQIVTTILGVLAIVGAIILCFAFNKQRVEKSPLTKQENLDFCINIIPGAFLCLVVWVSNLFL